MLVEWKKNMYAEIYLQDRIETLTRYRAETEGQGYTWWQNYLDERINLYTKELQELNEE